MRSVKMAALGRSLTLGMMFCFEGLDGAFFSFFFFFSVFLPGISYVDWLFATF